MTSTYEQVIAEVGQVCAADPTRVYRVPDGLASPRYVHTDGALGCLIAWWLVRTRGVPVRVLQRWSNHSVQEVIPELITLHLLPREVGDPRVVSYLECVQEKQDFGWNWQLAHTYARDHHTGYYGDDDPAAETYTSDEVAEMLTRSASDPVIDPPTKDEPIREEPR